MEIRDAKTTDAEGIQPVARQSLEASYGHFIDGETIDQAVEGWYDTETLEELLAESPTVLLLAVDDNDVVGFAHGAFVENDPAVGELYWLHVAPSHRDRGLAHQLLGEIHDHFSNAGARRLRGFVLTGNEDGVAFYEAQGFERSGTREVEVADETFEEAVFDLSLGEDGGHIVERQSGPDGEELFVAFTEPERGTKGALYPAYLDEDLADRYGWYCGNCESLETTMDSMGHIVCNACGNKRKATRWDASYL